MGKGLPYRQRFGSNFPACDKSLAGTAIHRTWNLVWCVVYVRTWIEEHNHEVLGFDKQDNKSWKLTVKK